jgi:hypothetical protein
VEYEIKETRVHVYLGAQGVVDELLADQTWDLKFFGNVRSLVGSRGYEVDPGKPMRAVA